jgi:hypothetical protein
MDGLPDERVQAALEELLGWPAIARSPQLARFLAYIVSTKLRGEESGIKAYSIAVDVFGRPAAFDPQSDPIVRVQARRLRALLDQFYDEGQARTGVRIHLPVGRYVPEFLPLDSSDPAESPRRKAEPPNPANASPGGVPRPPVRRRVLLPVAVAAAAVVILALGVILVTRPQQSVAPPVVAEAPPAMPSVLIGDFGNLTGIADLDGFGARLGDAVGAGLAPFEDFDIGEVPSPGEATQPYPEGTYLIDGLINPGPQGIEVAAVLTGSSGETLRGARGGCDCGAVACDHPRNCALPRPNSRPRPALARRRGTSARRGERLRMPPDLSCCPREWQFPAHCRCAGLS